MSIRFIRNFPFDFSTVISVFPRPCIASRHCPHRQQTRRSLLHPRLLPPCPSQPCLPPRLLSRPRPVAPRPLPLHQFLNNNSSQTDIYHTTMACGLPLCPLSLLFRLGSACDLSISNPLSTFEPGHSLLQVRRRAAKTRTAKAALCKVLWRKLGKGPRTGQDLVQRSGSRSETTAVG
jgi:hypothetical protein